MTRNKSQEITKVPFSALYREDKDKIKAIDKRYSNLCSVYDTLSWNQLRRKVKPYTIFTADSKITIMAETKKKAVLMAGYKPRDITKITVEYEDCTVELKLNVSKAKPKCKLQ